MKTVLVGLKRVVDYNVRVRVKSDGSGVETHGAKMSVNPFDEIALEEALRIRDAGHAEEVLVVSIGTADTEQQLRTGLAMGADRAILVNTDAELSPLAVARVFLALIDKEGVGLVMLGKQSIDGDNNQTGQMLAALWDRPQATFASTIQLNGNAARVTREVDAGLETIEIDLPAVITADLRLNEPRFVKLPDIIRAKKQSIEEVPFDELGIQDRNAIEATSWEMPLERSKGIIVGDVPELIRALKEKGISW